MSQQIMNERLERLRELGGDVFLRRMLDLHRQRCHLALCNIYGAYHDNEPAKAEPFAAMLRVYAQEIGAEALADRVREFERDLATGSITLLGIGKLLDAIDEATLALNRCAGTQ